MDLKRKFVLNQWLTDNKGKFYGMKDEKLPYEGGNTRPRGLERFEERDQVIKGMAV